MNEVMVAMAMQLGSRGFRRVRPPHSNSPMNVYDGERAYRRGDDNVLLRPTEDHAGCWYGEQHCVTVIYNNGMLFQALGAFDKSGKPLNEDAQKIQGKLFSSLKIQ